MIVKRQKRSVMIRHRLEGMDPKLLLTFSCLCKADPIRMSLSQDKTFEQILYKISELLHPLLNQPVTF